MLPHINPVNILYTGNLIYFILIAANIDDINKS